MLLKNFNTKASMSEAHTSGTSTTVSSAGPHGYGAQHHGGIMSSSTDHQMVGGMQGMMGKPQQDRAGYNMPPMGGYPQPGPRPPPHQRY